MASDEFQERLRRINAGKQGLPLEAEEVAEEEGGAGPAAAVPPLGFAVLAMVVGLSLGAILCVGLNMFLAQPVGGPGYWETVTGLVVLFGGLVWASLYGARHLAEKPFVLAGAIGVWVGLGGVAALLAVLL